MDHLMCSRNHRLADLDQGLSRAHPRLVQRPDPGAHAQILDGQRASGGVDERADSQADGASCH
jgi:hypothetical protein